MSIETSDDFLKVRQNENFLNDKSMLCERIFGIDDMSFLIAAPRRTGNSTNLSMLKYFCEIPEDGKKGADEVRDYFLGNIGKENGKH